MADSNQSTPSGPSGARPVIEVKGVRRTFRSTKKGEGLRGSLELLFNPQYSESEALKGVDFSIEEGAFVGLIGANGAGKTTLLKILSGLIPPTTGEASVLGFEPFSRTVEFRRSIALVMGQKAQLWWDLPAVDAFDLLRAIYDIPLATYRERLGELAKLLDVERHLNTQIRRLSLGERMKMELIGALLHWPKVIFLDEPTIGLDVLAAHKLREFLREFNRRERATIILTSHNMEDIERLCSRVIILREGAMVYDGSPAGLTREGELRLRLRFKSNPELAAVAALAGLPETAATWVDTEGEGETAGNEETRPFYLSLKKEQIVPTLQKLMTTHEIADMGIEEPSLESVIQRLYRGEGRWALRSGEGPSAPGGSKGQGTPAPEGAGR
jgi:ABC-2 type transport system ATP-binding protein